MKKFVLALGLTVLFSFGVTAQESTNLDEDFVKNSSSAASYEEWTGGYAPNEINTAVQIMDIGRRLGNGIRYQEKVQNDPNPYNKGNPAYKYSSARIYGGSKRGADVFLIGHTATVDTIKCLKLIIRGYLETAFSYSPEQSRILAEKICYWNTNNYENHDYFDSTFEASVKSVFDGRYERIGLSSSYKDWKGSILVIPHVLTGNASYEPSEPAEETQTPEVDAMEEPEFVPEPEPYTEEESYSNSGSQYENKSYEAAPVREPVRIAKRNSLFGLNTTMVILIGVALLVVIALIIILVTMLR